MVKVGSSQVRRAWPVAALAFVVGCQLVADLGTRSELQGAAGTSGSAGKGSAGKGNGGAAGTRASGGSSNAGSSSSGAENGGSSGSNTGGEAGAGGGINEGGAGGSSDTGGTGGNGGNAGADVGTGGGISAGMGGTAAGSAGGGAGGTGTGGMSGSAGTGSNPYVFGPLDGLLWTLDPTTSGRNLPLTSYPLDDNGQTCPPATSWPDMGIFREERFVAMGTPGQEYAVTVWIQGVVSTQCYSGGIAASTAAPSVDGPNNTWYAGGVPAQSAWNTFELHVEDPPVANQPNVYYLNAFPADLGWCEKEGTFLIDYTATFSIMGNSAVRLTAHDVNCTAHQNCGPVDGGSACEAPRTVDLSGNYPQGPGGQPYKDTIDGVEYYYQWIYFDVTSIEEL